MPSAEDIQGWMNVRELAWLREQAATRYVIVEIGTWKGRSTAALAEGSPGVVFACDHFRGSPSERRTTMIEAASGTLCRQALDNLADYIAVGRLFVIEGPISRTFLSGLGDILRHRQADMIFIDGSHDSPDVVRDIQMSMKVLKPGGLLCGHDRRLLGVHSALDELVPDWKEGAGSIWHHTQGAA